MRVDIDTSYWYLGEEAASICRSGGSDGKGGICIILDVCNIGSISDVTISYDGLFEPAMPIKAA